MVQALLPVFDESSFKYRLKEGLWEESSSADCRENLDEFRTSYTLDDVRPPTNDQRTNLRPIIWPNNSSF